MARVKNPKYLLKQWNTYHVQVMIPATLRKYFPQYNDFLIENTYAVVVAVWRIVNVTHRH